MVLCKPFLNSTLSSKEFPRLPDAEEFKGYKATGYIKDRKRDGSKSFKWFVYPFFPFHLFIHLPFSLVENNQVGLKKMELLNTKSKPNLVIALFYLLLVLLPILNFEKFNKYQKKKKVI